MINVKSLYYVYFLIWLIWLILLTLFQFLNFIHIFHSVNSRLVETLNRAVNAGVITSLIRFDVFSPWHWYTYLSFKYTLSNEQLIYTKYIS